MFRLKLILVCFMIFSVALMSIARAEDGFHEKYSFQVDSVLVSLEKSNEEIKSYNLAHPIIIQEGRSMLDTRFFHRIEFAGITWDVEPHGDYKYTIWLKLNKPETKDEMIFQMEFTYFPKTKTAECITNDLVLFNDKELKLPVKPIYKGNQAPYIMNTVATEAKDTHYLLPLRFVFETFGYTVDWNNETREITASK